MTSDTTIGGLPVPTSLSIEAQTYLAEQARRGTPPPVPAPTAVDEILAEVEQVKQKMVAGFAHFDDLPVTEEAREVNGVRTFVARPHGASDNPVMLDFHGGGFTNGGGEVCRLVGKGAANRSQVMTWAVDYRRPPLHPFPAAIDDAVSVYRGLLDEYEPEQIVVGGGVAAGGASGGNMAAALIVRALQLGLPRPAGLLLFCPFLDLTMSGDTWATFERIDRRLSAGFLRGRAEIYASGADFTDPVLSPLLGDVSGFPPAMLVSGTRDILLSDTILMHRKLRDAGVAAELHVMEAMSHGGWDGTAPEDESITREIRRFIGANTAGSASDTRAS